MMFLSSARLLADLERWQHQGWVTESGGAAIRREWADRSKSSFGLYGALAVLGAVLLGFAAMSFVAANWATMSKLSRLLLLGSGIAASYGAAHELFRRRLDVFAHAAVLSGIALFGVSIMLIAQMYHMDGHPPDAVWLWSLGALAAGLLLRSNPALAASIVLISVWSIMEVSSDATRVHWAFLPMWALAAGGIAVTRWVRGLHLLALALSGWIVMSCLQHDQMSGRYLLAAIGIGLAGTAAVAGDVIDRWRKISATMLGHGMVQAFIALFIIQFVPLGSRNATEHLWLWAGFTLALLIGSMAAAWRAGNQRALWLAYVGFTVEIFALYIAKLGTLLNTSAFFLITGLLVIALAALAYRMRETFVAPVAGAQS